MRWCIDPLNIFLIFNIFKKKNNVALFIKKDNNIIQILFGKNER